MNSDKKNLWGVILKVIVLFVGFELFWSLIGSVVAGGVWQSMVYGKYGLYFFSEGFVLLLALILLALTGKLNILKKKKLKFKDSLKLGLPIVVISILMLLTNIIDIDITNLNILNLISLVIYAVFIGMFEEILFRGIFLGELLDNFNKNKKQVVIAIVISAVIFSLTHVTNLLMGQDLFTTILQVVQTFAIGILLGSMYYESGNIWSVIFLHGFYDFSILLGDVNLIKDCTMASTPLSITITSLVSSIILSAIYIAYSFIILNKNKEKEKKYINIVWLLVGCFFFFNVASNILLDDNSSNYYVCYEYEEISLNNVETHYYSYDDYLIGSMYHIYLKDNKVYLNDVDLEIDNVERVVVFDNQVLVIAVDEDYNYKLYYSTLDNINNGFDIYTLPDISAVGYLIADEGKYPLFKSTISDILILKDNKIMLVTE